MYESTNREMIYIGYTILFFGFARLLVSIVNLCSKVYLPKVAHTEEHPKVSILIPARNEEGNIKNLLKDIEKLTYPNLETIVYDDCSSDNTAAIVRAQTANNPNLKLIIGDEPQDGWLGKNFACHNLSLNATGEYYLFLDADVRVKGEIIEKSIFLMRRQKLKLLSIFPEQIIPNRETLFAIPLMNWILLSLLPLILIRLSSWVSFSAANGQFMLFESQTYRRVEPHRANRANRVEDIAICRYYKKNKLRVSSILGNHEIECKMYDRLNQSIDGFSKNIFEFFGGSIFMTLLFASFTTFAPLALIFLMNIYAALAYIGSIILIRIFVSAASQQSVARNLLYMVPQHYVFLKIIFVALKHRKQKSLTWKGRNIA